MRIENKLLYYITISKLVNLLVYFIFFFVFWLVFLHNVVQLILFTEVAFQKLLFVLIDRIYRKQLYLLPLYFFIFTFDKHAKLLHKHLLIGFLR